MLPHLNSKQVLGQDLRAPLTSTVETGSRPTGNTAKLQAQAEVRHMLLEAAGPVRILDVGCVGARGQFDFWAPLLDDPRCSAHLRLCGVDVQTVDNARRYAQDRGWNNIELHTGSAYELANLFSPCSFDMVVSTQVMEHLKHRRRFLENAYAVLKEGGTAYFTLDAGHFHRGRPHGLAALRSLVTMTYAHLRGTAERYYDHAVFDSDIETLYAQTGFTVQDKRFYCLSPLKEIHNQKLGRGAQDAFLRHWKELEDLLNTQADFIASNKHYFMALYYKLRRGPGQVA